MRDSFEDLKKQGVQVVGVSFDKAEAQKKFKETNKLPFTLLADTEGKVIKAFGVKHRGNFSAREAILVVEGKVVWHNPKAPTGDQGANVLEALKALKSSEDSEK